MTLRGAPAAFLELAKSYTDSNCLLWPFSKNRRGYAHITKNGHTQKVAHLILEANGKVRPTPKHEAAHSCGNGGGGCIALYHLRWATHKENEADKLIHGTRPRGEKIIGAKLTEEEVLSIRQDRRPPGQIAAEYGISHSHIRRLRGRTSWKWLCEEVAP